jgi:hypothetical protein
VDRLAPGSSKPIASLKPEFEGLSDFELCLRAQRAAGRVNRPLLQAENGKSSIEAALDAFFGLNHHGAGEPVEEALSFAGHSHPP